VHPGYQLRHLFFISEYQVIEIRGRSSCCVVRTLLKVIRLGKNSVRTVVRSTKEHHHFRTAAPGSFFFTNRKGWFPGGLVRCEGG
jgi:hypothetical protein